MRDCARLKHGQTARPGSERKSLVESCELLGGKYEVTGGGVVGSVRRTRCLWNREQLRITRQKRQRNLVSRCAASFGYTIQHLTALAGRTREIVVAEWRVSHHRDAVLLAPRKHGVLDRALVQVIQHLVAGDLARARHRRDFIEIARIEIADAPTADFPGADQVLEGRD